VSGKYDNAMHNNQILTNKVYRVFASKNPSDGTLYKKHKSKTTYDKTAGTPVNCRIWNESVNGVKCPDWLDKKWYVDLAKERIGKFLGE
jgi:DNA polymerase